MCTTSVFIVPSVAFARVTRMPGGEDCGHRPIGGFVSGDVQCMKLLATADAQRRRDGPGPVYG
jgi:hypothetical protein